jgi:hypothetical protein
MNELRKHFSALKRMRYDISLITDPSKGIEKYKEHITAIVGYFGKDFKGVLEQWVDDKDSVDPDMAAMIKEEFGMPAQELGTIILSNWDLLENYINDIRPPLPASN